MKTKITIVSVLFILATITAFGTTVFTDSNAVHAKWTVNPLTPVFLALTSNTRENSPERLNATFSVVNQDTKGPVNHWLYVALNVTGASWKPNATSSFQWADTVINGITLSAQYVGHTPDGFSDEWAFGIFTLPVNQRYDFTLSLTLNSGSPLTQLGRPYGDYDLAVWTAGQS